MIKQFSSSQHQFSLLLLPLPLCSSSPGRQTDMSIYTELPSPPLPPYFWAPLPPTPPPSSGKACLHHLPPRPCGIGCRPQHISTSFDDKDNFSWCNVIRTCQLPPHPLLAPGAHYFYCLKGMRCSMLTAILPRSLSRVFFLPLGIHVTSGLNKILVVLTSPSLQSFLLLSQVRSPSPC